MRSYTSAVLGWLLSNKATDQHYRLSLMKFCNPQFVADGRRDDDAIVTADVGLLLEVDRDHVLVLSPVLVALVQLGSSLHGPTVWNPELVTVYARHRGSVPSAAPYPVQPISDIAACRQPHFRTEHLCTDAVWLIAQHDGGLCSASALNEEFVN